MLPELSGLGACLTVLTLRVQIPALMRVQNGREIPRIRTSYFKRQSWLWLNFYTSIATMPLISHNCEFCKKMVQGSPVLIVYSASWDLLDSRYGLAHFRRTKRDHLGPRLSATLNYGSWGRTKGVGGMCTTESKQNHWQSGCFKCITLTGHSGNANLHKRQFPNGNSANRGRSFN